MKKIETYPGANLGKQNIFFRNTFIFFYLQLRIRSNSYNFLFTKKNMTEFEFTRMRLHQMKSLLLTEFPSFLYIVFGFGKLVAHSYLVCNVMYDETETIYSLVQSTMHKCFKNKYHTFLISGYTYLRFERDFFFAFVIYKVKFILIPFHISFFL